MSKVDENGQTDEKWQAVNQCGGVVKWLTRQTSNLLSLAALVQTLSGTNRSFLEQETLHRSLSTGWFQERIRECFYKLKAFFTIKLK